MQQISSTTLADRTLRIKLQIELVNSRLIKHFKIELVNSKINRPFADRTS